MTKTLKEKVIINLTNALKEKRDLEVSTLRMLQAVILNKEKEKRFSKKQEMSEEKLEKESSLTDEELIEIIFSESKKRKEASAVFEKGGRRDLAEKENKELEILKAYLPEQLSEKELRDLVKEVIKNTGALNQKDMGKVMAGLMPKVKGRAEGSMVSQIVKELLS